MILNQRLNVMVDVEGKAAEGLKSSAAAIVAGRLTSEEKVVDQSYLFI